MSRRTSNARKLALGLVLACALGPASGWAQPGGEGEGGEGGPPQRGGGLRPDAAAQLVEIFKKEPPVRDVQDAALRFFRVHPEKVSQLRRGAQLKGLLPELELSFNNEISNATRNMLDALFPAFQTNPGYKENETNKSDRIAWGVRATWGLDRLLFNPEELDVASLVGVQEGLLREVTTLYYTRRRLQVGMVLNPPQDDAELITEALRLEEATATLDALTGGYVSKKLKEASEAGKKAEGAEGG